MLTSNPIRAIPLFSKGSASHITAHCSQSVNILRRPLVTLRVLCSKTHLIWKSCRIHPFFSPEFKRRFRGYFVVPLSRQASYLCFFFCLPAPENFFSDVAYFCLTSAHRCASSSTLAPRTLASSFTDPNFAPWKQQHLISNQPCLSLSSFLVFMHHHNLGSYSCGCSFQRSIGIIWNFWGPPIDSHILLFDRPRGVLWKFVFIYFLLCIVFANKFFFYNVIGHAVTILAFF